MPLATLTSITIMGQKLFIDSAGGITTLRTKKGNGVQLPPIGKTENTRVSEIVWSEDHQKWTIDFINKDSVFYGTVLLNTACAIEQIREGNTREHIAKAIAGARGVLPETQFDPLLFDSYEEAVTEEIRLINMARSKFGSTII